MTYAPSAAASYARSGAAGDAGTSSGRSDNAHGAAPPAPEGLEGMEVLLRSGHSNRRNTSYLFSWEPESRGHRNYEYQYLIDPGRNSSAVLRLSRSGLHTPGDAAAVTQPQTSAAALFHFPAAAVPGALGHSKPRAISLPVARTVTLPVAKPLALSRAVTRPFSRHSARRRRLRQRDRPRGQHTERQYRRGGKPQCSLVHIFLLAVSAEESSPAVHRPAALQEPRP